MAVRSPILAVFLAVCLVGCGALEPDEAVPIEKLPEPVLKAAKTALPDVTFTTAWKEKTRDGDAYEVRGQNARGRIRDVKVSATGKVLEVD